MTTRIQLLVLANRSLFYFAAAFWLLVAVLTATGRLAIGVAAPGLGTLLAVVMASAAVVMAFVGWGSLRGNVWIDGLAVLVALGNLVLTIADEVGLYDVGYLVFSVALLVVLVWALVAHHSVAAEDETNPLT